MNELKSDLIEEQKVMGRLGIKSRQTLWTYTKKYNFPKPVKTHPKAYLRSAVNDWIINGGINQKAS